MTKLATTTIDLESVFNTLKHFCRKANDYQRFAICQPFVQNWHAIGTDGGICVSIYVGNHPDTKLDDDGLRFPKIDAVFSGFNSVGNWSPLPEILNCLDCENVGTITNECGKCINGRHECPCCEKIQECGHCNGVGEITRDCEKCVVTINGNLFSSRLVRLASTKLPGLQVGYLPGLQVGYLPGLQVGYLPEGKNQTGLKLFGKFGGGGKMALMSLARKV